MKIIALYNMKGGVGKTATAVNLAYMAAQDGAQTLLCDLDPQGSASFYFRIRPSKKFSRRKFLRGGKHLERNIKGTDYEKLDLLPSDLSYRNLDIALDSLKRPRKRLRGIFKPLKKDYDFIFLDCPPNITLVSENIFNTADCLLVPLIPTTLSMLAYEKLAQFFKSKKLDRSRIAAFFSMVERRKKMHQETMQQSTSQGGCFLNSYIPYTTDVEKMGLYREPVPCFQPRSTAAQSYAELWRELKQTRLSDTA